MTTRTWTNGSGLALNATDLNAMEADITSAQNTANTHASRHATGGADPVSPSSIGAASATHTHAATDIASGTLPTARLGTGSADGTKVLYGDGTWKVPTPGTTLQAVDTIPVIVYGDSYTTSTGASDTAHGFPTRAAKAWNASTTTLNGVSGTTLHQAVGKMVGDSNSAGGTWTIGTHGLLVVKSVINSVINITSANDATEKVGFQNALKAFLRIARASQWVPDSDSSCVYTGTWTTPSVNKTNGGVAHKTSTNGDYVTITTTASEIAIMLLGFSTNTGSSFTVTVNGASYNAEITNTGLQTTTVTDPNGWYPISVRVSGLSGTSTIKVTNTAAADFYFDGYLLKSATPPSIIVCKDAIPTTAGLQINGADTNRTASNLTTFNSYIDTIVGSSEFNDGTVIVADPGPYYDNTTMESTSTRPHPNNIGHAVYAYALRAAANQLGFSTGLNL